MKFQAEGMLKARKNVDEKTKTNLTLRINDVTKT